MHIRVSSVSCRLGLSARVVLSPPFIARGFGQHLGGALMVHGMGIMRRMVGGHVLNNARTGGAGEACSADINSSQIPFSMWLLLRTRLRICVG